MYNIGILTSCNSEHHLSMPVFRELYNIGCNVFMISIEQNNISASHDITLQCIHKFKLDFILAVADRPEQVGGVLSAFHNKIPIGHLYAGDHNTISNEITTFDDIHRHAISLYSNIQFCSCAESKNNIISLFDTVRLTPNANVVGATHFDNVDMEKVHKIQYPPYKYALILINSETSGNDDQLIIDTVSSALKYKNTHHFIILAGNGDSEIIHTELYNILKPYNTSTKSQVEHEHFLSLIMRCDKFITNSSCVAYEAPFLMDTNNIIKIGNRNINRTVIPRTSHLNNASGKTARLIKKYLQNR